MVIIARWPQVSWPHLAILHTADDTSLAAADDLLRCDWLRRVRLIITWAVRHLAIVTLGMIGGDASELFYWQVRYLDIYQFYDYGVNITNRKNIKPWMTVLLCTFDKYNVAVCNTLPSGITAALGKFISRYIVSAHISSISRKICFQLNFKNWIWYIPKRQQTVTFCATITSNIHPQKQTT